MDQHNTGDGDADEPRQGRRDNSASRDSNNVPGMAVSGGYAGIGTMLSDDATRQLTDSSLSVL